MGIGNCAETTTKGEIHMNEFFKVKKESNIRKINEKIDQLLVAEEVIIKLVDNLDDPKIFVDYKVGKTLGNLRRIRKDLEEEAKRMSL